jgi:hypothetical protein
MPKEVLARKQFICLKCKASKIETSWKDGGHQKVVRTKIKCKHKWELQNGR